MPVRADIPAAKSRAESYRYERKFVIADLAAREVESIVRRHPALFSEIFHRRYVNNVYFDSEGLSSFDTNINGTSWRVKTRIRWYGDAFGRTERPVLERKFKRGIVGRKESYPLLPLRLSNGIERRDFEKVLRGSDVPVEVLAETRALRPTLLNRYARRYFLSADTKFRITLDTDMRVQPIRALGNLFVRWRHAAPPVVLELKYALEHETQAAWVTQHIPFRVTKSSKYVSGMQSVYHFLA